jgi:outer membrane murein-binding lipoprotein Lpp
MTTTELVSSIISAVCMIITAVLAWVSIYRVNRVNVSFSGVPVDKQEFDQQVQENKEDHDKLFSRIGGVERGLEARMTARIDKFETDANTTRRLMHKDIEQIGHDTAALKKEAEIANQRMFQMDGKIDRLIERQNT